VKKQKYEGTCKKCNIEWTMKVPKSRASGVIVVSCIACNTFGLELKYRGEVDE
jgi:hypothetical protein